MNDSRAIRLAGCTVHARDDGSVTETHADGNVVERRPEDFEGNKHGSPDGATWKVRTTINSPLIGTTVRKDF